MMTLQAHYDVTIVREKIKAAREHQRIPLKQVAHAVCLSQKNIREIEDADTCDSFYSYPVKVTAAKRVGQYLGLNESEFLEVKINEQQ
jgi:hypothetical protein